MTRYINILDVLRELSVAGQECLVEKLEKHGSLRPARLVCKAFRTFVDGGVRKMKLWIRLGHQELLEAGRAPPVLPRCTALDMTLYAVDSFRAGSGTTVMRLFTMGLPEHFRERITSLTTSIHENIGGPSACLAVSGVLSCLPAVIDVDLHFSPSLEPLQLRLLYESLALLPHLDSLRAPGPPLGAMAAVASGSLCQRLRSFRLEGCMSARDCPTLARMEQLTQLFVSDCQQDLGALLDNLPPQLQKLTAPGFTLTLTSGTISAMETDKRWDDAFGAALLHCRLMGRRLPRLKMGRLRAADIGRPCTVELLRRSDEVEVEEVRIHPGVSEDGIRAALQHLPRWPRRINVGVHAGHHWGDLGLPWTGEPITVQSTRAPSPLAPPPSSQQQGPEAQNCDQQQLEEQEDRILKPRLWAALGRFVDSVLALPPATDTRAEVVLLRGPWIEDLMSAPKRLESWMWHRWRRADGMGEGGAEGYGTFISLPDHQVVLMLIFDSILTRNFVAEVAAESAAAAVEGRASVQAVPVPTALYDSGADLPSDAFLVLREAAWQAPLGLWKEFCSRAAAEAGGHTIEAVARQLRRIVRMAEHFAKFLRSEVDLEE